MTIIDIRWYPYRIPFRSGFVTAHGTLTAREGAIVEVLTETGLAGIGEIAPLPAFAGGGLAEALASLSTFAPQLSRLTPGAALEMVYACRATLPPTLVCGLECALLDVLGRMTQHSIASLLAEDEMQVRLSISVNAVIGAAEIQTTVQRAREAVAAGFRCLKLKPGGGVQEEIERVAAVRSAVGMDLDLRLDANEGWSMEQAETILSACAPFAIQYVEQPLKALDLQEMAQLRQRVQIPIAADEAVYDLASARRVLAWHAADVLILKPQLLGGLAICRQIIAEAAAHGVECVITSTLESGIGLLGALHLVAAAPQIKLACGLATLPLLTDDLLCEELLIQNGQLTLPQGAGLGCELDREALKRYQCYTGTML
jgi:o-succinylbenzoate synthase